MSFPSRPLPKPHSNPTELNAQLVLADLGQQLRVGGGAIREHPGRRHRRRRGAAGRARRAPLPLVFVQEQRHSALRRQRSAAALDLPLRGETPPSAAAKAEELISASSQMREKVKSQTVLRALKIKEGEAFARGQETGRKRAEAAAAFQRDRDAKRHGRETSRLREEVNAESFKRVETRRLIEELGSRGVTLCNECMRQAPQPPATPRGQDSEEA